MSDIKRTLYSLLGNSQRLDGGAMFGNAPKLYGLDGSPLMNKIAYL